MQNIKGKLQSHAYVVRTSADNGYEHYIMVIVIIISMFMKLCMIVMNQKV